METHFRQIYPRQPIEVCDLHVHPQTQFYPRSVPSTRVPTTVLITTTDTPRSSFSYFQCPWHRSLHSPPPPPHPNRYESRIFYFLPLLQNLTVPQLVKWFRTFHGTRSSYAGHLPAKWSAPPITWIQSIPSQPVYLTSISIFTSHLRLGHRTGTSLCFPTKPL